jgi:phage shock protein PspC (stress-responsive transcriptional regulator)
MRLRAFQAHDRGMTTTSGSRFTRSDMELSRPRQGRMIAGVCAGIADRYGWSRSTVRIVAVLSCLLPGPQFLAYLALWALMPARTE